MRYDGNESKPQGSVSVGSAPIFAFWDGLILDKDTGY